MSKNPYKALPSKAFWKRSVAAPAFGDVDPVGTFDLKIAQDTKVATAGSCFAQHIARHLQQSGFNYFVAEPGHPILGDEVRRRQNYGLFSARYGNIYTARQLLQLMRRAYGEFTPIEDAWIQSDGSVKDPYRPNVQPDGFTSVSEMHADRKQHLAAVRRMFETLDVFVFTLGLTEYWASREDGAAFPLCPGVDGGEFNPEKHAFRNQDAAEVIDDMSAFIRLLREKNPEAQIILTVSPVPLMATAEPQAHVLSATTYSKSVLRVAAETLRLRFAHVHYFPSFEIVTGAFSRGRYFAEDLRDVTEEGVSHVMRLFLKHAAGVEPAGAILAKRADAEKANSSAGADVIELARRIVAVECDEAALDR